MADKARLRHIIDYMRGGFFEREVPFGEVMPQRFLEAIPQGSPAGATKTERHRASLRATAAWLSHDSRRGMTYEAFARRMDVDVSTVRRWVKDLALHIEMNLSGQDFPERYQRLRTADRYRAS